MKHILSIFLIFSLLLCAFSFPVLGASTETQVLDTTWAVGLVRPDINVIVSGYLSEPVQSIFVSNDAYSFAVYAYSADNGSYIGELQENGSLRWLTTFNLSDYTDIIFRIALKRNDGSAATLDDAQYVFANIDPNFKPDDSGIVKPVTIGFYLTEIIGWVGAVFTALTSNAGALSGLMSLFAIGISVSALMVTIKYIKSR